MTVQTKRRMVKAIIKTVIALWGLVGLILLLKSTGYFSNDVIILTVHWKKLVAGAVILMFSVATYHWAFPVKRELRKELTPYEPRHKA